MTRMATVADRATLTIGARPPFDFTRTLAFIAEFPATQGEQVIRDGVLIRAMRAGGMTVALHITAADATGSAATGSGATGSGATGSAATGADGTGSGATGSDGTGSAATGSDGTGADGSGSDSTLSGARESGSTGAGAMGSGGEGSGGEGVAGVRVIVRAEEPVGEEIVAEVRERVGFFLGLDDDLTPLYELAAGDPPFARVVERMHGYHQVKFPSPVELLCWAILSQRTPIGLARRAKHALMRECGGRIVDDGTELLAFPEIDRLLALPAERIAALIGNPRKARQLHGALRGWAELDEDFLIAGPYEEVRDRLLALPGIGPWSAGFLMIRGLGRMERIPADRATLQAVAEGYGHNVGEREFQALAARYGAQQGYWAHYLRAA